WSSGALRNRLIEALPAEQQIRDRPTRYENPNDQITEAREPAVEVADKIPETAFEAELAGDEAERLDAADQERDHDGDRGDGEIVPDLADRIEERPAIGADHQHAVGGIDQCHASGEQRRKNHDGADGHAAGGLAGGDGE